MAEIVQSSSMERSEIGKLLPLKTPLSLHIFTSYYCDFRCIYCAHSLDDKKFKDIFRYKQFMSLDTFKIAIDQLKQFPNKLKMISFDGWGEPLLNPDLPKMIAYAKQKNVAERLELVTNANSLSNEKANAIIDAGLDRIRISLQGLDADKYRSVSNVNINFDDFKSQIKYLYNHRKQASIYIKIIDVALDGRTEQEFYDMFGSICDHIAVEHMVPTADKIDYSKYKDEYEVGQQGYIHKNVSACPFPFYMMIVEPDGEVRTCCATRHPLDCGNIKEKSLYQIWNGDKMHKFWKVQLGENGRFSNEVCRECTNPDYGVQPGDDIDPYCAEIIERLGDTV